MHYAPQHPIHYLVGSTVYAPAVMKRWRMEPFEYQIRYLFLYASLAGAMGLTTMNLHTAVSMFCFFVFIIGLMSLPAALFDMNTSVVAAIRENFGGAIIAFHGFLITYLAIYTTILAVTVPLGLWTVPLSAATTALPLALIVGYSMQLVVLVKPSLPWGLVPGLSIGGFMLAYWVQI